MKFFDPFLACAAASLAIVCTGPLSAEGPPPAAGDRDKLIARYVEADDAAFEKPDVASGPWNALKPRKVILLPQNITTPSKFKPAANEVEVRIVHNGRWIGIAVGWQDETRDETTASGVFGDAAAIGFPRKGPYATSPFMGGHGAGMEINQWRALWQRDVDRGYQQLTDLHPHTVADEYRGFHSDDLPDSNPASSVDFKRLMDRPEARIALPAVAMGNPMTQLDRRTPVEQAMAEGFGTLTAQKQQDARASAVHENGRWMLVITRPLDTGDEADVQLATNEETGVSFAIWNGSEGDVSGRKSYSMFTPLVISPAR